MEDDNNDSNDPSEKVKTAFLYLLAGLAILIGTIVMTYLVTVLVDRLDRQTNAGGREVDQSQVSRKANLWGLQISERREILKDIFANTTSRFELQKETSGTDLEMVPIPKDQVIRSTEVITDSTNHHATTLDPVDTEPSSSSVDVREVSDEETGNPIQDQQSEPLDDTDHEKMCCICLVHYEQGDSVMTGTICKHVFHEKCCLLWLEKNDHCPYCRNRMMNFTEFRAAGIRVLGEQRVQQLSAQTSQ
jgi:hypothetical protein